MRSQQYLLRARECEAQADEAVSEEAKLEFMSLAAQYRRLAAGLKAPADTAKGLGMTAGRTARRKPKPPPPQKPHP